LFKALSGDNATSIPACALGIANRVNRVYRFTGELPCLFGHDEHGVAIERDTTLFRMPVEMKNMLKQKGNFA
jgi:hypothetical protein